MKKILWALLSLTLPMYATLHSHLLSKPGEKPGEQFLPGGGQPAGFRVAGRTVGPVAVNVLERPLQGAGVARGRLAPAERTTLSFAKGVAAVICNASAQQAMLDLDVTNSPAGLDMRSEPVRNK